MDNRLILAFYMGLAILAAGLVLAIRRFFRRIRCAAYAAGDVPAVGPAEGKKVRLTVRFTAGAEERTLEEKRSAPETMSGWTGRQVSVRYNPDDPADFYVEENRSDRTVAVIMIALGLFDCVAAVILMGPEINRLPFGRELSRLMWMIKYRWFKAY